MFSILPHPKNKGQTIFLNVEICQKSIPNLQKLEIAFHLLYNAHSKRKYFVDKNCLEACVLIPLIDRGKKAEFLGGHMQKNHLKLINNIIFYHLSPMKIYMDAKKKYQYFSVSCTLEIMITY